MTLTRRDVGRLAVAGITAAALPLSTALAQTQRVRLPLHEFLANQRLLAGLRKGVAAMKRRRGSDPLSWFYQAAIHGVTDRMWTQASQGDPEILNVNRAKYWNQCPHFRQNSANFLPWHRAYTHHFEEILRMHTEEDDFAIPYWDYSLESQRQFPKEFGIEHLDGDFENDTPSNINPLFHPHRDFYLCGYEHGLTDQVPLSRLDPRATDTTRVMASPVFFGETELEGIGGGIADADTSTRGLLEQSPHDHIHRVVGGVLEGTDEQENPVEVAGAMAKPRTAGFDPIFPIHHSNMDRIWVQWACMPGKGWGKLPTAEWFNEKPWFFFDTNGREVNRPRKDYFDHRALGVKFKDEDPNCRPLELPAVLPSINFAGVTPSRFALAQSLDVQTPIRASATAVTSIALVAGPRPPTSTLRSLNRLVAAFSPRTERVTVTFHDVLVGKTGATGFDVFIAPRGTNPSTLSRQTPNYLGPISLFVHADEPGMPIEQTFDLSPALAAMGARPIEDLEFFFVPYALRTPSQVSPPGLRISAPRLDANGFSLQRHARDAPVRTHQEH